MAKLKQLFNLLMEEPDSGPLRATLPRADVLFTGRCLLEY
jgi:hypothetical protein